MKTTLIAMLLTTLLAGTVAAGYSQSKPGLTIKGKIFVTEKKTPIAGAQILLMPADKSPNGAETKTDENGDYKFDSVAIGKYKVSIKSYYKRQEDVPCQFLIGKTKDIGSTLTVMQEKGQIVQWVRIDDFSVKGNKEIVKDFDLTCRPAFGGLN